MKSLFSIRRTGVFVGSGAPEFLESKLNRIGLSTLVKIDLSLRALSMNFECLAVAYMMGLMPNWLRLTCCGCDEVFNVAMPTLLGILE